MIDVQVSYAHPSRILPRAETLRLARRVLRGEGKRAAELSIVFIGDRDMVRLNTRYLRHRWPTDVLSFPLGDRAGTPEGEVYVNVDQARRQRRAYGTTVRQEVERLVVHGLLHLTGYRDDTPRTRARMARCEDSYLNGRRPARNGP